MRIRTSLAVGAAVLCAGPACSIDDNSGDVMVQVTSTAPIVVRGDKVLLSAVAFRVSSPADTLRNIQYVWSTSDPNLATIEGSDSGYAELTGVNAGMVGVTATAVSFESSQVGTYQMRVADILEVDSVRPTSLRWGEKLALYGVGVRNVLIADLGTVLFPDTLTFQGDPNGLGRMEFWVPPPARTTQLFGLGPGVFFTMPDTTVVDTADVYEYNDTTPSVISLDAAGPYPTLPLVRFFNPALSFEEPPRDSVGTATAQRYEWYRFTRSDTTLPVTLVLKPSGLTDSTGLFIVISDSIRWLGGHAPGVTPTWFMTSEGNGVCSSNFSGSQVAGNYSLFQSRRDSMVLTFRRLPGYGPNRGLHVLAFYSLPQRYALSMYQGYTPTDARIVQDRFEENDLCSFADSNFVFPATQIILNASGLFLPFLDSTLTIDTPHEIDWYRFRLTAAVAESVMFKARSRPFGGLAIDRSDVDMQVIRASDFGFMGSVSALGTRDSMRLLLPPGDYYLIAYDFAGEVTRYSICIRPRLNCNPLLAGVEASVESSPRVRSKSHPRREPNLAAPGDRRQPFRP